jgi:hypothetical protein
MDALAVLVLRAFAWVWGIGSVLFGVLTWFGVTSLSAQRVESAGTLFGAVLAGTAVVVQGIIVWALLYGSAVVVEYAMLRRDGLQDTEEETEQTPASSRRVTVR